MGGVETNLIFLFQKGFSFYYITDLNLVFAVSIAVFVFLRERINARLRLSLHFPRSTWVNIFYIVFTGFCFVVALYIIEILIFNLIVSNVYTGEIIGVLNCGPQRRRAVPPPAGKPVRGRARGSGLPRQVAARCGDPEAEPGPGPPGCA